jgi:Replication initiator protein, pSAM2
VVRSTRRRTDAADLPVRPMEARTVGRSFTAVDGKVYQPSMFITLTLPSYGRIVRGQGVPVDPARYDYRRAALDAMHFAKLVDRWVQNLRRGAGFKVQYFAAIEPQRRLAPHVHVAMRGAIERQVIRQVTKGTYFQLWWPSFDVPLYVHRSPVFIDGAYRDPDTHQELKTWDQALAELDQDPDARPAHVMRLGSQVDVKGILAGSKDADRTIGYLTNYLAKSMAAPMGEGQESGSPAAAHHDRLAAGGPLVAVHPGCGNWLRYGIQPTDAGPGLRPGSCPSKAHDAEHLGLGGRRVLVSRKWTGKTLDVHRADRAAVVRQVLEEAGVEVGETDRCAADVLAPDGEPRFVWSVLPPGESSYNAAIFAQIIQRQEWRAQYDRAKRVTGRTGPPVDNLSATHPPTEQCGVGTGKNNEAKRPKGTSDAGPPDLRPPLDRGRDVSVLGHSGVHAAPVAVLRQGSECVSGRAPPSIRP